MSGSISKDLEGSVSSAEVPAKARRRRSWLQSSKGNAPGLVCLVRAPAITMLILWVVECPSIPDWFSQGATREEALENVKDAIVACLAVRSERGITLTIETQQIEVMA